MQQDMREDEARGLLSSRLICEDPGDWLPDRVHQFTDRLSCGLISSIGERQGLHLDFKFTGHRRNYPERFVFTVFKSDRGRILRVYQLDIQRWPRLPTAKHSWPHEHIGATRNTGDSAWLGWTFDDILGRFCQTTNIEFQPSSPPDPRFFALRRS